MLRLREELTTTPWGKTTDPLCHDPRNFRYLATMDTGTASNEPDKHRQFYLDNPSAILESERVWASLVTPDKFWFHSRGKHAFILDIDPAAIEATSPMESQKRFGEPLHTPDELITESIWGECNEVVLRGTGVIAITGMVLPIPHHFDRDGYPPRDAVFDFAKVHDLPVIKEQYPVPGFFSTVFRTITGRGKRDEERITLLDLK